MPKRPTIPIEIQEEVLKIVEEFNRKTFTGEQHPLLKVMLGRENEALRRDLKASSFTLTE